MSISDLQDLYATDTKVITEAARPTASAILEVGDYFPSNSSSRVGGEELVLAVGNTSPRVRRYRRIYLAPLRGMNHFNGNLVQRKAFKAVPIDRFLLSAIFVVMRAQGYRWRT